MHRTHFRNLIPACIASLANFALGANYTAYAMAYFKESPNGSSNSSRMHLAVSQDGLNWLPLNQNNYVVQPALGTKALRDPFIYRMADGSFKIVATDNWNSEYIHVWSSADLRSFTDEKLIRMNTAGMHSWAPEVFWDEGRKQHAIIWSGNTDRNRIYVSYTTDFQTVTTPAIFFDPGFSVIDGHMEVGIDGYNYLYFKDERDWKLYGTRSTSLGARSFDANKFTTGHGAPFNGSHTEAAILIRSLDGKKWWLWGDSYNPINAVFYAWEASNLYTKTWTAVGRRDYTAPPNAKHATIVQITTSEYDQLIAKWGRPDFDIVKSYRFPTAFVRHSGTTAKVSNYPFDPIADMQWKVVPGLADPTGISFQSVNAPTQYLRESNRVVGLATNDNTTAFKSAATFYKTAGFADPTWTSLKSHSNPGQFLRMAADSTLRLDAISASSTTSDKEDATFRLVYGSIGALSGIEETPTQGKSKVLTHRTLANTGEIEVDLALDRPASVTVRMLDIQGRLLATSTHPHLSAGPTQLRLAPSPTPGVHFVRVAIDGRECGGFPVAAIP